MSGSGSSGSSFFGIGEGVGGIFSGFGDLQQSSDVIETGDRNARIFEQQAESEREGQRLLEVQKRRLIKSRTGEQEAAVAAGGGSLTGSALAVITDSLTNANLDIAIDKYNSETQARLFESQADETRREAQQESNRLKLRATSSFISGGFNIARSLLTLGL